MGNPGDSWHGFDFEPGPIAVEAAVFDDFRLTSHLPPEDAPAVIERDRRHMAARPGFNRKLLPLRIEPGTGIAYSGGRYLLDTYENGKEFMRWVAEEFALDGCLLFDRPDFADVSAALWRVIGAHDFKDLSRSQRVFRTEQWTADSAAPELLERQWPSIRDEAERSGLSSVWLLHDPDNDQLALVTVADAVGGAPPDRPDFASIAALERAPSLIDNKKFSAGLEKVFDRTSWVFTIWLPYREGEDNEPSIWPNSPPLPGVDLDIGK